MHSEATVEAQRHRVIGFDLEVHVTGTARLEGSEDVRQQRFANAAPPPVLRDGDVLHEGAGPALGHPDDRAALVDRKEDEHRIIFSVAAQALPPDLEGRHRAAALPVSVVQEAWISAACRSGSNAIGEAPCGQVAGVGTMASCRRRWMLGRVSIC